MTDNEIIKALECCAFGECHDCPFNDMACEVELDKYALDLINRQKTKNAELQHKNSELEAEIERLEDSNKGVELIKSEAIKEFAERLKAISHPYGNTQMVFELQIDNLVKEMIGDK